MLNTEGNRITYFGHSTFSLTTPSGQVALIDPWVMTNPWCPEELKNVKMGKGGSQKIGDFEITMTHAFHSNSIEENGVRHYGGEPAGYVIRTPGGFTVYHAGDTALFGDMKLIGELYKPDVAMLPIGDRYTMGPKEAAYAIRLLGVKHVIPMHYATFSFLTGTVEALAAETKMIKRLKIHALKPGGEL